MARRSRKNPRVRADQRAAAAEREALERRWRDDIVERPDWDELVTFAPNLELPRHRWLPYRQGLAKELVDLFLETECPDGPILDPFAGTGTVPLAVAQHGGTGVGVEAIAPLAALARMKGAAGPLPRLPDGILGEPTFAALADRLDHPLHRAALLAAAGRSVAGDGRARRDRRPPADAFADVLRIVKADLDHPVPGRLVPLVGDARRLPLADASCAGALTSPPYLSRYDYVAVNKPTLAVWRVWQKTPADRLAQIRAHRGARGSGVAAHPAATEAIARLRDAGETKLAKVAGAYMSDMQQALAELARVLRPGAPLWLVVAGAAPGKVYFPVDLLLAERADGFVVEHVICVRRLTDRRRMLGALGDVDPRESIVVLRRDA